jgi:hypothetical protein
MLRWRREKMRKREREEKRAVSLRPLSTQELKNFVGKISGLYFNNE